MEWRAPSWRARTLDKRVRGRHPGCWSRACYYPQRRVKRVPRPFTIKVYQFEPNKQYLLAAIGAVIAGLVLLRQPPLHLDPQSPVVAAYYTRNGGVDESGLAVGHVRDQNEPLGPHDVRVKVAFVSLNPADEKLMRMFLNCRPTGNGVCGIGLDGSGVVVSCCRVLRVFCLCLTGGFRDNVASS